MRLGSRILLGYLLIFGTAFYFLTYGFLGNIRTRYLEGVEEVLVDQSRLLAGLISADMTDGRTYPQRMQTVFNDVYRQDFSARIYGLEKTTMDLRVTVTDSLGIVVFDSRDPHLAGADYSAWRDVWLTLRGKYGARTSHEDPDNPHASILYVAAPVMHQGRIAGVLTVGKPTANINRFLLMARRQITLKSIAASICVVAVSTLFMFFVFRPIKRLTAYANAIRMGKKTILPRLGTGEIGDMGRAFEKMRLALEGKAYVERYVQTLTHEIKSPVSAIAGAAELLEEEMPPAQRARFLANIRRESDRIRNLVDRLLALSTIEGMHALKQVTTVDIAALINQVHDEIKPQLANTTIQVAVNIQAADAISGDPFLLRQAIANLMQNAVDFSPDQGQIRVTLTQREKVLTLVVEDDGPGIPDFASKRIFDKFFSLRRPDTGEKSTGLGLNFVKEIVDLHNGRIRLENRHPSGTRAIISLMTATG